MNGRIYRVYLYLIEMYQQSLDASRSPFLIDVHDECEWFAEYYAGGITLIGEIIEEK